MDALVLWRVGWVIHSDMPSKTRMRGVGKGSCSRDGRRIAWTSTSLRDSHFGSDEPGFILAI